MRRRPWATCRWICRRPGRSSEFPFALRINAYFGMEVVAGFRGLKTAFNLVPHLQPAGSQTPFATMYRPPRQAT